MYRKFVKSFVDKKWINVIIVTVPVHITQFFAFNFNLCVFYNKGSFIFTFSERIYEFNFHISLIRTFWKLINFLNSKSIKILTLMAAKRDKKV